MKTPRRRLKRQTGTIEESFLPTRRRILDVGMACIVSPRTENLKDRIVHPTLSGFDRIAIHDSFGYCLVFDVELNRLVTRHVSGDTKLRWTTKAQFSDFASAMEHLAGLTRDVEQARIEGHSFLDRPWEYKKAVPA